MTREDHSQIFLKGKGSMQRSKSTPNVRAMAGNEESIADKKKNKLGYHRTAVACGHCRRRKIRCVLAPDDANARCSNCIRLKKDCHFYPVDQQPPFVERTRSGSRADATINDPETSISSSSPGLAGNLEEQMDEFQSNHIDTMPISQEGPHYPHSMIASDRGVLPSTTHDFSPDHALQPQYSVPYLNHSPRPYERPHFETHPSYWQSGDNSFPGSYPNLLITPISATLSHSSQEQLPHYPMSASRPEFNWAPPHAPLRSMSVGGPSEHNYHPYHHENYPSARRSMTSASDMQQVVTGMSQHNTLASITQTHSTPSILSYDEHNHSQIAQPGYHPAWPTSQVTHLPGPRNDPGSQGWYTPSPGLPNVREEDFHQQSHPP